MNKINDILNTWSANLERDGRKGELHCKERRVIHLRMNIRKVKTTADGDCSHKIKMLAPWKKNYDQPTQHSKKQRHTLLTKVHLVKPMVFPVVMYGCESWTIKTEGRRTDVFKLQCWRRLLRVPRTARQSNQSIIKEINPQYSLEGLMLRLKLQYFGHLIFRANSLQKTLMLGKIDGRRRE